MNVFLDTNVLLDVLGQREPFLAEAGRIWGLAEQGRFVGYISALSFPNVFYVVRKAGGGFKGRQAVHMMSKFFVTVPLDQDVLGQALHSTITDYEDAIQVFSARKARAQCLVTRNTGHFPQGDLPILTPAAFLDTHFPE